MTPYEKTSSKKKTNRQTDQEKMHGKKSYRVRKELEKEGEHIVRDYQRDPTRKV